VRTAWKNDTASNTCDQLSDLAGGGGYSTSSKPLILVPLNLTMLKIQELYRSTYIHIYATDSRSTVLIHLKTTGRIVLKFRIDGSALKVVGRI
jgi:hypothetical protein